ncbi:heavy-metal-associated domain-containing protein [Ligilactobacillus ceti]|uniref:HMA domain-containing protein n=1 Tax=Ligilactobacillus ceti DSM 22408 TaxID=1122146 RepID=A0A0R2KP81_9LACO|nr:heavy metal-associated domain-containing protein [Ligilactobacillus ceti]KRN89542.1 hypothetical protein IV53_GL001220 [Ligilactobacillus ceti DSM 22408]
MKKAEIAGMKCAGCISTVEEKLSQVVSDVTVDLATNTASFNGDATLDQLNAALSDTPYSVVAISE